MVVLCRPLRAQGSRASSRTLVAAFATAALTVGVGMLLLVSPADVYSAGPVTAPAIGRISQTEISGPNGKGLGEGFELGPTYAAFQATEAVGFYNGPTVPAGIVSDGAETTFRFEYAASEAGNPPPEASPSWKPFTSGEVSGTVTVAEESADPKAELTGLTPETKYYLRLTAENSAGKTTKVEAFETTPDTPSTGTSGPAVLGGEISATSATVGSQIVGHGYRTKYRFEYADEGEAGHAPAQTSSLWKPVTGGEGAMNGVAPSELFLSEQDMSASATLTGLSPSTTYYARVHVESEPEGRHAEATSLPSEAFKTFGAPAATTFSTHAFEGESTEVLGAVTANDEDVNELQSVAVGGNPTGGTFTLTFEGQTTSPIPFNARPENGCRCSRCAPHDRRRQHRGTGGRAWSAVLGEIHWF